MSFETPDGTWEVVPANMLAGIPLAFISIYFLVRVLFFILALTDMYAGVGMKSILFPKRSNWFPDRTAMHKAALQCMVGGIILFAYLFVGAHLGWLKLIERQ